MTDNTKRKIGRARKGVKYKENQLVNRYKPIVQISPNGEIVRLFASGNEASKELGISRSNIFHVLKGQYKQARGFVFKYQNA